MSFQNLVCASVNRAYWMNHLIEHLTQVWEFHQIVILRNVEDNMGREEEYLFKVLGSRLPIIQNPASTTEILISKSSTLYIMIQELKEREHTLNLQRAYKNLASAVNILPSRTRPRCLMIIFNDYGYEEFFHSILEQAWRLKFLDFSIISQITKYTAKLNTYNPFERNFQRTLYLNKHNIFPDKLSDMNKYVLRMPYMHTEPYIKQEGNNTYSGDDYIIIDFVSKALNFDPQIKDYNVDKKGNMNDAKQSLINAVQDVESGKMNLLPFTLFDTHYAINDHIKIERGIVFKFDCFCVATSSSIYEAKVNIPYKTIGISVIAIIIVYTMVYVANRLKVTTGELDFFSVTKLILMTSSLRQPRRLTDKIMYLSVVIVSMMYFQTYYAKWTTAELSKSQVPLSNFKNVAKSGLVPYINSGLADWAFNDHENKYLMRIKSMAKFSKAEHCLRYISLSISGHVFLTKNIVTQKFGFTRSRVIISWIYVSCRWAVKKQRVLCIIFKTKAEMYSNMYRRMDGTSEIRIGELEFLVSGKHFIFEEASPYVDKFDQVIIKIVEAGILEYWKRLEKKTIEKSAIESENYWDDKSDHLMATHMLFILLFGHAVAAIIFVTELIYSHCNMQTK